MNGILNYTKTAFLLAIMSALMVLLGGFLFGESGARSFFIISIIMNLGTYWFSDKLAISAARAKPLTNSEAPELHADLEELSKKMELPIPRLYISAQAQPNAFATGRNQNKSAVCVTTGLLQNLSRDEVKGVLAHELAHIKNRDVLIATVAATMASAITMIGRWGALSSSGRNSNSSNILLLILSPIVAIILQMAISRSREYVADEGAAKAMGSGKPLANALRKISGAVTTTPMDTNPAYAPLYIANPLRSKGLSTLFSTHPPAGERIARLESSLYQS